MNEAMIFKADQQHGEPSSALPVAGDRPGNHPVRVNRFAVVTPPATVQEWCKAPGGWGIAGDKRITQLEAENAELKSDKADLVEHINELDSED